MNNGFTPSQLAQRLGGLGISAQPVVQQVRPGYVAECEAVRVNLAGNHLSTLFTPSDLTGLERVYRKNPPVGILTATPSAPVQFELGALNIPNTFAFMLMDYRFAIYVPSGVFAGNTEELEDRQLSTSVGYDVRFTDIRASNVEYELEPSDPIPFQSAYAGMSNAGVIPGEGISGSNPAQFETLRAVANSNLNSGSATLPQRHRRDSQLAMPFTYIINSQQRVNFNVRVFRPIPMPIAFFEVEMMGLLIGWNALDAFMKGVAPCMPRG